MFHTGLVSITFRELSPRQIVDLVVQAGLEDVEWGGDIHVPHGDIARAQEVRQMTVDAGLLVPSYGSYYRVGHEEPVPFEPVLKTALALGAPIIRVWAGKRGSTDADQSYRSRVIQESRRIADLAAQAGLEVSFEFHGNTLTDTNASALQFYQEIAHPSVSAYWQPIVDADEAYRLQGLRDLLPWLSHMHVLHWNRGQRQSLVDGTLLWQERFALARETGRDHGALIECVHDNTPEGFLDDAATLKTWLSPR